MRTATSTPGILYETVEKTASCKGIPQGRLFELALEEFIERHNGQMIIRKINIRRALLCGYLLKKKALGCQKIPWYCCRKLA